MNDGPLGELRILIVAEHASARFGGEAILPLHYFRLLRARRVDAWLLVHSRTRAELAALFPDELSRMYFIPDTRLHRLLDRCSKRVPRRIGYFTFQWLSRLSSQLMARRLAKRLVREHRISVIHQPIPVSPRETSLLHGMGAPVIMGPMNGGMSFPPGFGRHHARGERAFMAFGRFASKLLNRLMPGKLRADVLLVANERTRRALPHGIRGRVIELVENGVDLSLWTPKTESRHQPDEQPVAEWKTDAASPPASGSIPTPARFVFTGRLEDWKAVDLLIDAFKSVVAQTPATLEIIGDGPMRHHLEEQVRRLRLGSHISFAGWQAQVECAARMRCATALVLPSLYECGGAVVLEAMAIGIAVIATDWGGPADYLDPSCGILVPPQSPTQFVSDLAAAMLRLARSPELCQTMGQAGRRRAIEQFDWERKADRILEIYAGVAMEALHRHR